MKLPDVEPYIGVYERHEDLREAMLDYARCAILAERERCARLCDQIEAERWSAYKDRNSTHAGDDYVQGQSDGATLCAAAIRKEPT